MKAQPARTSVDMGSHSTGVPVQHSAHPGPLLSGMTNTVSEICILKRSADPALWKGLKSRKLGSY